MRGRPVRTVDPGMILTVLLLSSRTLLLEQGEELCRQQFPVACDVNVLVKFIRGYAKSIIHEDF